MAALNIGRQVQGVFDLTNEEEVCPEERNILAEVFEKLNLNENKWMQDAIGIIRSAQMGKFRK